MGRILFKSETLGFSVVKSDWLSCMDQLVWIIIVELLEVSFDYKFKVSDLYYIDCIQVIVSCIQVIAVNIDWIWAVTVRSESS